MMSKQSLTISLWALWFKRNKLVNEGLNFKMHELMGFIKNYAQDCCSNKNVVSFLTVPKIISWYPPTDRATKLNFDASFLCNTNEAIVAVLARDAEGQVMGACTYPLREIADAFIAEARTCERALYFARDMGFSNIILEGDSLTIFKKVKSTNEDRSILRPITKNIRFLERFFKNIEYRFVPREVNRAVYALAVDGRRRDYPCCWVEEVPDPVAKLVELDRNTWLCHG
ncbi:hypothetical protein J1N35_044740 [Gossypium stocksii]|uniref:RNase H type-1 domain-containing protein n=1 Tax=Gossypium stocksii TaxID=47602 RepID=A0A9D3UA33_9ROSI|nr:hypothetical protein J1N35_044740 [Gossypium stocksii]